jgi:hypothetical protein
LSAAMGQVAGNLKAATFCGSIGNACYTDLSATTINRQLNFPLIAGGAISGFALCINIGGVAYYVPACSSIANTA